MNLSKSSRHNVIRLSQKSSAGSGSGGKRPTVSSASGSSSHHHHHASPATSQQQQPTRSTFFGGGPSSQQLQQQHQSNADGGATNEIRFSKPMSDILEEAAGATGVDLTHLTGAKIKAKCCAYCVWCYCACIQGNSSGGGDCCCCGGRRKKRRAKRRRPAEASLEPHLLWNYACMCFFAFLTGSDFAVIIPTLWDRLHEDMNGEGAFMGLVISAYSFSGVLMGLVMGKLSDDIKQTKPFLIVATLFSIVGHILYFVGLDKWLVLSSRAISGLSLGASTVALAYIARTTTDHRRTSVISIVMASRQFGLMLGPGFNLFLRMCNFKLAGLPVDRKSSPGLFMAALWFLAFFVFLLLYSDTPRVVKKKSATKSSEKISERSTASGLSDHHLHHHHHHHHQQGAIQLIPLNEQTLAAESMQALDQPPSQQQQQRASLADYKREFMRIEIFVLLVTTFFTYFNQTSLETLVTPFTQLMFGWREVQNSFLFCCGGFVIVVSYVAVRLLSRACGDRLVLVLGLCTILSGLVIACVCLPFAKQLHNVQHHHHNHNETTTTKPDYTFFPAFVLFVLLDVLGLPAIAITSVSLFTKMIDNSTQGLGQGLQRGILGLATIVGPLVAGPLITRPLVLLGITLFFIALILVLVLVAYRRLEATTPLAPALTGPPSSDEAAIREETTPTNKTTTDQEEEGTPLKKDGDNNNNNENENDAAEKPGTSSELV